MAGTGHTRRFWILVALGVVILVMVVALIGISMAEGRPTDSASTGTAIASAPVVDYAWARSERGLWTSGA